MDCTPRLQPVDIGPVRLEDPVILAPMSGVTDMPFRQMVKRDGAGLVVSEMIASAAMVRENRKTLLMAKNSPEEFPMSVQLAGCEPEVMAEAAKLNEDRGAAIIDINFGCPVKKVVNGHAGSSLMRDEAHAAKILEATVRAVKLPVTLKMRTGWDANNRNAPNLARIAEQCGIKMLTVHGRTRCQFYDGQTHFLFFTNRVTVGDRIGTSCAPSGRCSKAVVRRMAAPASTGPSAPRARESAGVGSSGSCARRGCGPARRSCTGPFRGCTRFSRACRTASLLAW
jgi:hypothetical protein